MEKRRLVLAAVTLAAVAIACGNGDEPSSSPPAQEPVASEPAPKSEPGPAPLTGKLPCEPRGTKLEISAKALKFSPRCLAAPADERFTIRFVNHDTEDMIPPGMHNVGIYTDDTYENAVFDGRSIVDATITYKVEPLAEGLYFFRCDVHPSLPSMQGRFVVQ